MKKKAIFLLMSILVLSLITSCSNSTGNPAAKDTGSTTSETKKTLENASIRYGIWDKNQEPAMQDIVTAFKKVHPEIDVKVEVTPWAQYWTKMEAGATGGALPDVFWMTAGNTAIYASNGIIANISDNMKTSAVDLANYPKAVLENYSYNGSYYGMPKDTDASALWYNKELFDKAHIPYPDDSWDWNKVKEVAKLLTDPAKGVWGIAAPLSSNEGYYHTIYQSGGYIISDDKKSSGFDKSEALEGLKYWTDFILTDKSSPSLAQMTETEPNALFESGKIAMLYGGSWNAIEFANNEYTKNRVDVAVMAKGKVRAVASMGLANVLYAKTKYPKQAWEFLQFLGSKEAGEIQGKTGTVIPSFHGTEDLWVKSFPNFHLQAFIDELQYAKPWPISVKTAKWNTAVDDIFKNAWTGKISIEDAAKQAGAAMNKILAEEQK